MPCPENQIFVPSARWRPHLQSLSALLFGLDDPDPWRSIDYGAWARLWCVHGTAFLRCSPESLRSEHPQVPLILARNGGAQAVALLNVADYAVGEVRLVTLMRAQTAADAGAVLLEWILALLRKNRIFLARLRVPRADESLERFFVLSGFCRTESAAEYVDMEARLR